MKESLDKQSEHTLTEFRDRMKKSMLDLNEQGLNVALYWENPDIRKYVNIVPTSAISGEGIPDLLQLLVKLTQVGQPYHPQTMIPLPVLRSLVVCTGRHVPI